MSDIQNLKAFDPFADTGDNDTTKAANYIHIRVQQRNGRKTLTTVQGLPEEIDQKKLLKAFKKDFACNGTLVQDEDLGEVIQLQGDQRVKVAQFLVQEGITRKDQVKVHGF
ncbi:translation initiation factor SU [Blastocladiella britannica]|nr:translation initiation factor SU [Blastocladiella britannica]